MSEPASSVRFFCQGKIHSYTGSRLARLSDVVRDELGLTGTKIGCDTGDCGACTVMIDGRQVLGCLTAMGQVDGKIVATVEGLEVQGSLTRVQRAFQRYGVVQCGFCTPGMLMAATDLLAERRAPTRAEIEDAIAGVLCRCTGYRRIVDAIEHAAGQVMLPAPPVRDAVGASVLALDGPAKVLGTTRFTADSIPPDALWLRLVRTPEVGARVGDLAPLAASAGLAAAFTAADTPLLAGTHVGAPVAALVGSRAALAAFDPAMLVFTQAVPPPGETMTRTAGGGDVDTALRACAVAAAATVEIDPFVPASMEPAAAWARRHGDRIEIHATSAAPFGHRDAGAQALGIAPAQVRIQARPCGGALDGRLDASFLSLVAFAAWRLDRVVAGVLGRIEEMQATPCTPAMRISARCGSDRQGQLQAAAMEAELDGGAVAASVSPLGDALLALAGGPYRVAASATALRARHDPALAPTAAPRGLASVAAAVAHEAMMDDLAARLGLDRLEIRRRNALRSGDRTPAGATVEAAGLIDCLDRLAAPWRAALADAEDANRASGDSRRGVGIAAAWHQAPAGETATIRIGLSAGGRVALYAGIVDAGQGAVTVLAQIAADELGLPVALVDVLSGDSGLAATTTTGGIATAGEATRRAAAALRTRLTRLAGGGAGDLTLDGTRLRIGGEAVELARLPVDGNGDVAIGEGSYTAPTSLGFAAQLAIVDVDLSLGMIVVRRVVTAHDVGRVLNPLLLLGEIHGGVAHGLGMALMERYLPGATTSLRDYLIPTVGDMPEIDCLLVETAPPPGLLGAKDVGDVVPAVTAAAILGAIRHACGIDITALPVLPQRLRAALQQSGKSAILPR